MRPLGLGTGDGGPSAFDRARRGLERREHGRAVGLGHRVQPRLCLYELVPPLDQGGAEPQPIVDPGQPRELVVDRGQLRDRGPHPLDTLDQRLVLLRGVFALFGLRAELDRQLLDALADGVGPGERLPGGLLDGDRLLQLGGRGLRETLGLRDHVLRGLQIRLERGDVGHGARELVRALLGRPRLAPRRVAGVLDRPDPQQTQRHLLAPARRHVRERVELLLLGVDRGAEHLQVHVEQAADLGVDLGGPGREGHAPAEQLRLGGVALAADRPPDLVGLPRVLEHEPDLAVGEDTVGPDLLLLGPGGIDAVAGERDALHQRGLAGAVDAEDPDHPRGQLEVDLLEDPVVAQGELEHPHALSPRASSRNRAPRETTRSRSSPARSWSST